MAKIRIGKKYPATETTHEQHREKRSGPPATMRNVLPTGGEIVGTTDINCTRCGVLNSYHLDIAHTEASDSHEERIKVRVEARCRRCNERIDYCDVHILFRGRGSWSVIKGFGS